MTMSPEARSSAPDSPVATTASTMPATLHVEAWTDPLVDRLGHDPRSRYVERYWLGVLGPSTTWLLRMIADRLDDTDGEPFVLACQDAAGMLGLGMRSGKHGPFFRSIERLCQFGLARRRGDTLAVRRFVPPVTQGQLKRLPEATQALHASWQQAQLGPAADSEVAVGNEGKARRLALTLLELGESLDAAERQLARWRIDGPAAQRALIWAHERHTAAAAAAADLGGDAA